MSQRKSDLGIPLPYTWLNPSTRPRAARNETAVEIYGIDYDTPDGTCVRDYIHVADIAEAHLGALEYLLAKSQSCALNLANARGYSVKEVIAAAERVCGRTITTKVAPRRPGDPPILIGSAKRVERRALESRGADC